MNRDADKRAMASQGFINCIINNLKDHVMQPGAVIGVTDIHTRSFPHSVKAL